MNVCLLAAGFLCAARAEEPPADEIVAVVGGDVPSVFLRTQRVDPYVDEDDRRAQANLARERRWAEPITRREVEGGAREILRRQGGEGGGAVPLPEALRLRREAEARTLEALIDRKLAVRSALAQGFFVSDSEVEDEILSRLRTIGARNIQEFAQRLADQGDTLETFRRMIREDLLVTYFQRYNARVLEISPRRIEEYYRRHLEAFARASAVQMRQILIEIPATEEGRAAARARAEECRQRARDGMDPSELARTYSDYLATREMGGLDTFRERGALPEAVERLADGGPDGAWLGPVEAEGFFWIVRVEERRAAGTEPLSEAQEQIRRILREEEAESRLSALVETERRRARVWRAPRYTEGF